MPIDVRNIHLGETGMDQLLSWMRRMGHPQTLQAVTFEYLTILRLLVLEGEEQAQ